MKTKTRRFPASVFGAALLLGASAGFLAGGQAGEAKKPAPKAYEAISLLGEKLVSPAPDKASLDRYTEARQKLTKDPSEENFIGLGRQAANAGRYRDAIKVFSDGLAKFPQSYRLLRHRGHRYITIRQLVRAIDDLEQAAGLAKGKPLEIEPDSIPYKSDRPLSNTHYNIYYHLGLAYFLAGEYPFAEKAFRDCLAWAKNDDSVVAATDWLYLTLRRMKLDKEAREALAAVRPRATVIENTGYYQRILMYRGAIAPELMLSPWAEDAEDEKKPNLLIRAYGLGNWDLWGGDVFMALGVFENILKEKAWSFFASIAAESDVAALTLTNPAHRTVEDALKTWTVMWNLYDLTLLYSLFSANPAPSYFSSEKKGLVRGLEPLVEHHRAFGFMAGGKAQDNRLWLEDVRVQPLGTASFVTARWFSDKSVGEEGPVQQGPVTFVLVQAPDGYRIVHAHFAND
jgi:tetratricopeptide (TPR) repeat protein